MGIEIERKFLVKNDTYKKYSNPILYRQGYLSSDPTKVVRIRVHNDKGYITIKGPSVGDSRPEFEYDIPYEDAAFMLDTLCEKPIIEKYRYKVKNGGVTWEVDEFLGVNKGLVIAEIELEEENQRFNIPEWVGDEVTGDPRYYNCNLIKQPYNLW